LYFFEIISIFNIHRYEKSKAKNSEIAESFALKLQHHKYN